MTTIVTDDALREMVREALSNTGWSNEDAGTANVNPVVDPSKAVTDPVNPNFTPQTKTEFGVAINQLVRNLPDTEMPDLYGVVKKTLDQRTEKEEEQAMDKKAVQGGSQEAIDDAKKKQAEAVIRKAVRKALAEAPLPPVKKIPIGVHGKEFNDRVEKTKAGLKKSLGTAAAELDKPDQEELDAVADGGNAPKGRNKAYKPGALGGMQDVGGQSFEAIAKEVGMSVAGAKQLVDKSLEKLKWLHRLPEDDRDILILTTANDYIKTLAQSGELTAPDIQLMKDHPTIVTELDGFREYLHDVITKARKPGKKINAFGEGTEADEVNQLNESAKRLVTTLTEVIGNHAVVQADMRGPYIVIEGREARPRDPNKTQYAAGTKVRVHQRASKGVSLVEMPNGEQWTLKGMKG